MKICDDENAINKVIIGEEWRSIVTRMWFCFLYHLQLAGRSIKATL